MRAQVTTNVSGSITGADISYSTTQPQSTLSARDSFSLSPVLLFMTWSSSWYFSSLLSFFCLKHKQGQKSFQTKYWDIQDIIQSSESFIRNFFFSKQERERKIVLDLLKNYDPGQRPSADGSPFFTRNGASLVEVNMYLRALGPVDTKEMEFNTDITLR